MDAIKLLTLLLVVEGLAVRQAIFDTHRSLIVQCTLEEWKAIAQNHAYAGDEQRAMSVANVILAVGEWLDDDSIRALGDWTFGNVYTIVGKGSDARPHYQAAERCYRAVGDWLSLARMSVGTVFQLYQTGNYEKARQLAEESKPILAASANPADERRLAGLANNLANIHDHLGRYEEALRLYEQKIALWEDWPDDPKAQAEIARTCINVGILKKRLNLWAEAEMSLEAGWQTLSESAGTTTYQLDRVRAEVHLADLLARRGASPDIVSAAFERARASRAAVGDPQSASGSSHDFPDLLHLDLLQAEYQLRSGCVAPDLLARLEASRAQAADAGQAREKIRADLLLAGYYARQGDMPSAIARCIAARKDAQVHGDWEMTYRAWHTLGHIYAKSGDDEASDESFRAAVAVIEGIGQRVASSDLRSGFLQDKLVVYQDLVGLYLTQGDPASALHWTERARSRELVEMLAGAGVLRLNQPESKRLSKQLAQARSELAAAASFEHRHTLETRITDLSRRIAAREPRAREWLTGETALPSELCAVLSNETLLLVYTIVRDSLWVLPVTRNGIRTPQLLGPVPTAEAIERDLGWLRNLAGYPPVLIERRAQALIASARRPLANWYNCFLAPLSDLLSKHRRIIVAPDGPLFRLPLHACYNPATGHYLLETHQVSYTPSATAWLLAGRRGTRGQGGVALAYAGEQLHHSTDEIHAILNAYPDFVVYTGPEATPERLQGRLARQAAYIHLAAHAVFRGDNPLFSSVELAGGQLETLDVLQLHLNATLVVLSACETGRGTLRGGEHLGLARAFLLAGTRSVLASHWAVDDAATAELMGAFYRRLAAGEQPAEALRKAQLTALSSSAPHRRHPYYWAPFFLLGAERR
ncbi:MAG: CHAT domain-containing protein [Chloroflexi bacterium]|nr:CHAT domain-containing protein [Chloroflexota bacterium]